MRSFNPSNTCIETNGTFSSYGYNHDKRYGSLPLSAISSFSCDTAMDEYTMPATPGGQSSPQDTKIEKLDTALPTPSRTPDNLCIPNNFCSMAPLDHELSAMMASHPEEYVQQSQDFNNIDLSAFDHTYTNYTPNNSLSVGQDGLPQYTAGVSYSASSSVDTSFSSTPGLQYTAPSSVTSPFADKFVVPSQTHSQISYLNDQTPLRANSINFAIQYDSPVSDYSECMDSKSPLYDQLYGMFKSAHTTPSNTPNRLSSLRYQRFAPLPTSIALHRAQQVPSSTQVYRARINGEVLRARKQEMRAASMSSSASSTSSLSTSMKRLPEIFHKSAHGCHWPECQKKFKRSEHLKRHLRTHTDTFNEMTVCRFCPLSKMDNTPKYFTRNDNYKAHLKLHTKPPGSSKRTLHHPEAAEAYNALKSKPRSNKQSVEVRNRGREVSRF